MAQPPILERYRWVILSIVGLVILGVFAFFLIDDDEPVAITINFPPPTSTHTALPPLEIYVTGAVANPESRISLPAGSRVEDAIEAAGGATDEADLSLINVARPLQDGEQVHVPKVGEQVVSEAAATLIDLNTATLDQLDSLPGIGPATAQAIIEYRTQIGGFATVAELENVSGIGEATLAELRQWVTVIALPTVQAEPTEEVTDEPEPTVTDTIVPTSTNTPQPTATPTESGPLDMNTATVEQLAALRGVGQTLAQAIIDYREENGFFRSVDDLDKVPGIGPSLLADIRPFVMVDESFVQALPILTFTPTNTPLLLNINTATLEELEALPGIGQVAAQAIIDYREENGDYSNFGELDRVPGIGPGTIEEIRPFITFED